MAYEGFSNRTCGLRYAFLINDSIRVEISTMRLDFFFSVLGKTSERVVRRCSGLTREVAECSRNI